jgi:hypothetical protein
VKRSGEIIALMVFIAAVSFVLARQDSKYEGRTLQTILSGSAEEPGPGDANGTGSLNITLNASQGRFCYELNVANIARATSASLNSGDASASGPVVIDLRPPTNGTSKDCTTLDGDEVVQLLETPENFYVNVLNAEFPAGAIRGQLTR